MLFYFDRLMELLLLPPGFNFLLLLLGFLLWKTWNKLATILISFSFISLWLLGSPLVAQQLINSLQNKFPPLSQRELSVANNAAIVVLEAGLDINNPEYESITVSNNTFTRLRYAAFLHLKTQAPILVSGNDPTNLQINQADYMADALQQYFNVPTQWKEDKGFNTAQEAIFAANILKKDGIKKVYIVTHAYHMPRSVYAFKNKGFEIIPAPTGFVSMGSSLGSLAQLFPTSKAMLVSATAIREYLGIFWYRIYYHF